jgi:hypothetical protein
MLTYRNISKTLTAILALSLLTTGCLNNDRSEKRDNARLQKKLKAERNRTADQKQKIDSLEAQITQLETGNLTLSQLKQEIENNQKSLSEINNLLRNTKIELDNAENRITASIELKSRLESLQRQLELRTERIEDAITQWKQMYNEAHLDNVFERIMTENKMDDVLTYQVSVIGVNVPVASAVALRKLTLEIQNSEDNKYKIDYKLSPAQDKLINNLTTLNEAKKSTASMINKAFALATFERTNVEDSYLVSAAGSDLIELRNSILALDDDQSILYVVIRPVQKVYASMNLEVKGNTFEFGTGASFPLMTVDLGGVNLSDDSELSNTNITKIYEAILSSKACETISADCLAELNKEGYLDRIAPYTTKTPVKEKLSTLLTQSAEQTDADIKKINEGVLSGWNASVQAYDENMELTQDTKSAKQATTNRFPIITEITIKYKIEMIVDVSGNGQIPIDLPSVSSLNSTQSVRDNSIITIELPIKEMAKSQMKLSEEVAKRLNLKRNGIAAMATKKTFTLENLSEMSLIFNSLQKSLK